MPRPSRDGTPARTPNRRRLTAVFVAKVRPQSRVFLTWDTHTRGLVLAVMRTGRKSWKVVYSFHGRPRWYHLGDASVIKLADARRLAARVMLQVAEGRDPQAERAALRGEGTFGELADKYRQYARRKNKSWEQADALVARHLLPRWKKMRAASITRGDVRAALAHIASAATQRQTLASASAVFSWAVREEFGGVVANPCSRVERTEGRSRERILSDSELPLFWAEFDDADVVGMALKMILLSGQRPGEVARMRTEHVADGWWTMPGAPVPALRWLGTKNAQTHRVWLPAPAQELMEQMHAEGLVFPGARGGPANNLDAVMRKICDRLGVERVTPHDLRRTHGSTITALGFGRDAMNRIQNHREGGIADVYDRHEYAAENQRVMEAVASHIVGLVDGAPDNVVRPARFVR